MVTRRLHFWQRAFWLRPGLLVTYGLITLALGVGLAAGVPEHRREAAMMEAGTVCGPSVEPPCLEPVRGWVDGPFRQRRRTDTWRFVAVDEPRVTYDVFDLPWPDRRRLEQVPQTVLLTALAHEDEVVAVRLPDGGQVETDEYGTARWWLQLMVALTVLGVAALLFSRAVSARRGPSARPGWWMVLAVTLLVPSVAGALPVWASGSVPWGVGLAAVGLVAALPVARIILLDRNDEPVRASRRG